MDRLARERYFRRIEASLKGEFRLGDLGTKSGRPPSFVHKSSNIEFRLISGGAFTMGLTDSEERSARAIVDPPPFDIAALQPAKTLIVSTFLLSVAPVLIGSARQLCGEGPLSEFDLMNGDNFPATAKRDTALFVAESLGCRLPYEHEWEYACRASTKTLFAWGNELPPYSELERWVDWWNPSELRPNRFGLYGVFSGDWCIEEFRVSHADDAETIPGVFVVKGGGSVFWPWQNDEWIWCMPAMRMPSTGLGGEGRCAFHLVRELPFLIRFSRTTRSAQAKGDRHSTGAV